MPSPNERSRNNVRAGVFVTLSLFLGLAVLFIITDAWGKLTRPVRPYTVIFEVVSGVNKLSKGSEVRVGGIVEGQVRTVMPQIEDSGAVERIEVQFDLRRDIQLFQGAQIFVSSALVGTESWLEIINVGDPAAGPPPNDRFDGVPGAGPLNNLFGPKIGDDVSTFSGFLADLPTRFDNSVQPTLDNLNQTSSDVKEIVRDAREEQWPRWSGRIDEIMAWAADATNSIDDTLEQGRGLFADGREVVAENRENVKKITDNAATTSDDVRVAGENVREISDQVRHDTMTRVTEFIERSRVGLDDAVALLGRFRGEFDGWSSDIDEVMGNGVLASQQLRLALMEVRRSPWKLIYQPTGDELQHELLYDAVRSFTLAVTDLSAATKSAQRILDNHSDVLAANPEIQERVQRNLVDSLSKYEQAQQRLFNVLLENQP